MRKIFKRNEQIPQGCWRIRSGLVQSRTWLEDGTERSLGFYGSGECLPVNTQISPYMLSCVTPVEIEPVQQSDIDFQSISKNLEFLVYTLQLRSVQDRLISLFQLLAKYGEKREQGIALPMLTHQQIADVIATTRVTVTRKLEEMEASQIISRKKKLIILR